MAKYKNVLAFVEGEPFLYNFETKEYTKISLDYDISIKKVKSMIERETNRPHMIEIWNMLYKTIPNCESFSTNMCKKSTPNQDTFESRFTRDISIFLDEKFSRKAPKKNNEVKKWLKNMSYIIKFSQFN